MADNSERILILSTILLLLIIVQSINYSPPRHIGTLRDIGVEIYTPQDNYTLGEGFTATVYLVNVESEDIWVEGIHQYTINSYSLSHPMEGIIADVQVELDQENPWIHVPANSRIVYEDVFCKPHYEGEFRICCLGAEKTVLILEQDYAWITATVLTVEHSPNLDIVEISSEDKDIPLSLFVAIDKALLEEASVQDEGKIRDLNDGRRFPISSAEAESIIHYFGGEIEQDKLNYEFYVSYVDYTFSILIQYSLPDITD